MFSPYFARKIPGNKSLRLFACICPFLRNWLIYLFLELWTMSRAPTAFLSPPPSLFSERDVKMQKWGERERAQFRRQRFKERVGGGKGGNIHNPFSPWLCFPREGGEGREWLFLFFEWWVRLTRSRGRKSKLVKSNRCAMIFRLSFISALGNIVSSISKVHSFCLKFVCTLVVMFYLDKVVHVCSKALELISDPK